MKIVFHGYVVEQSTPLLSFGSVINSVFIVLKTRLPIRSIMSV